MLWQLHLVVVAFCCNLAGGIEAPDRYSKWMAASIMSRSQGIMTGAGGSSELLQAGFTQKALSALVAQYPDDVITLQINQYIEQSAASVVPFALNATKDALSYPMDRLSNGNALLRLSSSGCNTTQFDTAAEALRQSIDLNRRNFEGGLWYFTYPDWSYLDGMYSLAPFYAVYSTTTANTDNTADLDDMQHQLDLLWKHTRNETSGLLAHGYDAQRQAVWADPTTGSSPHVWGRSLGWFAMALVDTLEVLQLQCEDDRMEPVLAMFQALAGPIISVADPQTGAWWQLLDQPGREGNYIESSGSAMFTYALLKGLRLGYLDGLEVAADASALAARAYLHMTDSFVVHEANGTVSYNGTVSVCSLNSTASYEYYIDQPIQYNSVLGSAAYVLASLEVELGAPQFRT